MTFSIDWDRTLAVNDEESAPKYRNLERLKKTMKNFS
jgi:hypothetical protein